MTDEANKCCDKDTQGNTEQEIIYTNDAYRVEKIGIKTSEDLIYVYGVYSNTYGVLEVETTILAKALNTADDLEKAVATFHQNKAFNGIGDKKDAVIATA